MKNHSESHLGLKWKPLACQNITVVWINVVLKLRSSNPFVATAILINHTKIKDLLTVEVLKL